MTWGVRGYAFFVLAMVGLLIACLGRLISNAIGRSNPARKRHGQFVLAWMLVGWLIGSMIGVTLIDNIHYWQGEADAGCAGAGLLIGWVIGMIHGGIDLNLRPSPP